MVVTSRECDWHVVGNDRDAAKYSTAVGLPPTTENWQVQNMPSLKNPAKQAIGEEELTK